MYVQGTAEKQYFYTDAVSLKQKNVFARYFVFADPKGPKIGNGGATLHVLEQLEKKMTEDELNKGILYA